ncbi:MAG: hypothetical protein KGI66_00700 [Patescibacteria group bacterium]|nr:hypothetical protein [Patescibacteria group bacterium]
MAFHEARTMMLPNFRKHLKNEENWRSVGRSYASAVRDYSYIGGWMACGHASGYAYYAWRSWRNGPL